MKKIILIALIFICSKGFGQSGETLHIKNPASFIIRGSQITNTPVLTLSAAKQVKLGDEPLKSRRIYIPILSADTCDDVIYAGGRDTSTPKFRTLDAGDIPKLSQSDTTYHFNENTTGILNIPRYNGGASIFYIQEPIKQDTIRVIMLCADTSHAGYYVNRRDTKTDSTKIYNHKCLWIYGYEVRDVIEHDEQIQDQAIGAWRRNQYNTYKHKKYLDADKKELSFNIIVWNGKQITQ